MDKPKTLYDRMCKCWRDGRDMFKRYRAEIDELEAAITQTTERRVVEFPEAPAGLLTTLFVAVGHFEAVAIRADLIRMWIEEEYCDWFHEKIENDALRFLNYRRTSFGKDELETPEFWRPRVVVEPLTDGKVQTTFIKEDTSWKRKQEKSEE